MSINLNSLDPFKWFKDREIGERRAVAEQSSRRQRNVTMSSANSADARDVAKLHSTMPGRPSPFALEAAVQEAEADIRLGGTATKPEYGLGVRYSHEEGDHIVLGSLKLSLPVASKGQELRAVSTARATRLRAELDAARTRIQLEVRAAFDAYNRRLARSHSASCCEGRLLHSATPSFNEERRRNAP